MEETRTVAPAAWRPGLDRDRVVDAARAIARRDGIDDVTMRRLAIELNTAPMSLYRHIDGRRDLLLGMLDAVAAAIEIPEVQADPRQEITAIAMAVRRAFTDDPWVIPLVASNGLASPTILPVVERIFAALSRGGLADDDLFGAYSMLWEYLYGENLASLGDRPDTVAREIAQNASRDAYPVLTRLVRRERPATRDELFAVNLHRILDGVLGAAGDSSTP